MPPAAGEKLFIQRRPESSSVVGMAEIVVKVPEELKGEIEKLHGVEDIIEEFLRLKVFELELKRSRELQRFVFEALASKSKLTEKGASELGSKVSSGMLGELKEKGLI